MFPGFRKRIPGIIGDDRVVHGLNLEDRYGFCSAAVGRIVEPSAREACDPRNQIPRIAGESISHEAAIRMAENVDPARIRLVGFCDL
jgi:hypothetical protein